MRGATERSGGAGSDCALAARSAKESCDRAGTPEHTSKSSAPSEYTSESGVAGSPRKISGAAYNGVPAKAHRATASAPASPSCEADGEPRVSA